MLVSKVKFNFNSPAFVNINVLYQVYQNTALQGCNVAVFQECYQIRVFSSNAPFCYFTFFLDIGDYLSELFRLSFIFIFQPPIFLAGNIPAFPIPVKAVNDVCRFLRLSFNIAVSLVDCV